MQLKHFSFKNFLLNVSLFIAVSYATIVGISILVIAFLFFTIGHYKSRIETAILTHTGYTLTMGAIHPGLSNFLAPSITIDNAKLTNPSDPTQIVELRQLKLVLSYSSIWNLAPIFDQTY